MFLRVANDTKNRICIGIPDDENDYFRAGSLFELAVIDRVIYLSKSERGNVKCLNTPRYRCEGYTHTLIRRVKTELPAFTVSEAEFTIDDDFLAWEIPHDHLLPWTRSKPQHNAASIVEAQLRTRLASATRHGVDLRVVVNAVPAWARGVLTPDQWTRVVNSCV